MVKTYKNRRDLICSKLDLISNISYIYPNGAFYVFIDISKLKDKLDYKNSFSVEFCNKFLEDYKVATVPGIAFGLDDYIREYAPSKLNIIIFRNLGLVNTEPA